MPRHHHWMQIAFVLVTGLFATGLGACRQTQSTPQPTPRPTPTTTPVPAPATRAPHAPRSAPAADPATPVETPVLTARATYTLSLPSAWRVLEPTNRDAVAELLEQVAVDTPARAVMEAAQRLVDAPGAYHLDLVAYRAADAEADAVASAAEPVALSVLTVPRHDLTLDAYLAALRQQIAQTDAQIEQIGLDDALRADGAPVGIVEITTPGAHYGAAVPALVHYQAIFYDSSAENLIIMTFTAPSGRAADLLPTFQTLIAAVELS